MAICSPPAAPWAAITIRRFGGRTFTLAELQEMGSLPPPVVEQAPGLLRNDGNLLIAGGTGSGKTTLLNALASLLPERSRVVSIEDTLELQIRIANCVRFEARGLTGKVTIRNLVRHSLRHRPDHIVVGEVRGAEAADLLQALNTGHGGSLATVHANNATSALSRLASCAMQASDELPWSVICRNIVDGIEAVIHQARTPKGERRVEQMVRVRDYDAQHKPLGRRAGLAAAGTVRDGLGGRVRSVEDVDQVDQVLAGETVSETEETVTLTLIIVTNTRTTKEGSYERQRT